MTRPEDGNVHANSVDVQFIDHVFRGGVGYRAERSDKEGRCILTALIPGATYVFHRRFLGKSVQSFKVKSGETLELPDMVVPDGPKDKKAKKETAPKELTFSIRTVDDAGKPIPETSHVGLYLLPGKPGYGMTNNA